MQFFGNGNSPFSSFGHSIPIGEASRKIQEMKNIIDFPRFYTLPPSGIPYPYLLVNPRTYKILFKAKFDHAILDCGVEIFQNQQLKDYPKWFLEYWKVKAKQLTEIFGEKLWITIPDYPDDVNPGQFGDNVSKTLKNIEDFISVENVHWIPVLQSRYLNKFSFLESCQRTRELIGGYPRIAIGTVCKTRKLEFIEYCCKTARHFFPQSHIHAFGLTLKALSHVVKAIKSWDSSVVDTGRKFWRGNYINSFDSLNYTFPREPHHSSCKTLSERQLFFFAYLKRIGEIKEKLGFPVEPGGS